MQSQRSSNAWLFIVVLITVVLTAVAAPANRGRDFSGYFDFSHVQEQGDLVQVTLHLKLFNHSNADAKNVIVTLVDSSPAMTLRGNFQPLKVWRSGRFIEISQEFSVTKREFNEWVSPPAQPNLVILYQDRSGKTWQQGAQVSRRPMIRPEE